MPLFVAEVGLNHEGNPDLALELIRQAAASGADIVKFQFGWRGEPGEINHLPSEQVIQMKSYCDSLGIEMMASVFTEAGFALAKEVGMARYKIASRTVVDDPSLCASVLAEGRETFVSLGMWDHPGWPFGTPVGTNVRYLYCRSKYPTAPRDIVTMPAAFGDSGHYGYSDHCLGIGACLVALSRGANLIEKHFTLNKASSTIRDHVLSASPDEFRTLTTVGREIFATAMGMMNPGA